METRIARVTARGGPPRALLHCRHSRHGSALVRLSWSYGRSDVVSHLSLPGLTFSVSSWGLPDLPYILATRRGLCTPHPSTPLPLHTRLPVPETQKSLVNESQPLLNAAVKNHASYDRAGCSVAIWWRRSRHESKCRSIELRL